MRIAELIWDDSNVGHIARHKVTPHEVEDICFSPHISVKSEHHKYVLSGQTQIGRYLNVVIERVDKGIFRPITAFEMSENYKRAYRKRMGKRDK